MDSPHLDPLAGGVCEVFVKMSSMHLKIDAHQFFVKMSSMHLKIDAHQFFAFSHQKGQHVDHTVCYCSAFLLFACLSDNEDEFKPPTKDYNQGAFAGPEILWLHR
jgi:hypothetical protein